MTIQELYDRIGGNYAEIISRLQMDAFVSRFITKFADDSSCHDTIAAWEAGDERGTFEAAHRAKGVCANLSLTKLANLSSDICEAMRPGNEELRARTDVDALVAELRDSHVAALAAIAEFTAQ